MGTVIEVAEGTRYQTSDEVRAYTITTTNLVSDPTRPTVVVYDELDNSNVTTTVMPNADTNSATGDVITLKSITALTIGHTYRVEVKFVVGNNTYERLFIITCIG